MNRSEPIDANRYAFVQRRFAELLPDCDDTLRDLYALLVFIFGPFVVHNGDVHDAWALWRARSAPDHDALVPYHRLAPETAALDDPYTRVVNVVGRELGALYGARGAGMTEDALTTSEAARQRAYDAVFDEIQKMERSAEGNAIIWRHVHAALDAALTSPAEYTAGGGLNPTPSPVPATLEVDGEAGAWYIRLCDEPVVRTTEQSGPIHIDWAEDGRMVGIEVLPEES
jgi:uncharacterized protein YuzE